MKAGGEEEGRKQERGGGAEEGRKILRACTLGDHTLTQSAAGGRSHLLTGGKKQRDTSGQEDEDDVSSLRVRLLQQEQTSNQKQCERVSETLACA